MSWHVQPTRDVYINRDTAGVALDPSVSEEADSDERKTVPSSKIGVDDKTILRWANLADRMRIKGVGEDYAKLLQAVGVDTVKELKYRNVAKLASAMREANQRTKLVRLLPSERRVRRWIDHARQLPLKITY